MDTGFSPNHERFRDEVRDFLARELTDELRRAQRLCPGIFLDYPYNIAWHRILHRQGWVAPAWPKQYGGPGWDLTQKYIWATEATLAGAPNIAPMAVGMCGPMLIGCGNPTQKAFYLPRILSGEDYWCQGYSEPAAGSDLASLKLKATTDGSDYLLNGSKIWTTHAHYANRMFCLVRSKDDDKPQNGITFLLLDMDTPGINVVPILFASGTHEVNQVFFDNARVPKGNIVGKEHEGWKVAKYLLEFERGGGGTAAHQSALGRLRKLAAGIVLGDATLADDKDFKHKLDETDIQIQANQYTEFRIMAALSHGQNPGPESSIMKNLGASIGQRITELATEAVGYYLTPHEPAARQAGQNVPAVGPQNGITTFPRYFNLRAASIAGGSNEVQKNIIAKLVLGL